MANVAMAPLSSNLHLKDNENSECIYNCILLYYVYIIYVNRKGYHSINAQLVNFQILLGRYTFMYKI